MRGGGGLSVTGNLSVPLPVPWLSAPSCMLPPSLVLMELYYVLKVLVHALFNIGRSRETEAEECQSGESACILFRWATSQGSLAKNDTLSCDWGQCSVASKTRL